jgi:Mg2+/Co2+ transporter CorB
MFWTENRDFAEIYEKGYSRIPVYRDNIDQIEGILFVRLVATFK